MSAFENALFDNPDAETQPHEHDLGGWIEEHLKSMTEAVESNHGKYGIPYIEMFERAVVANSILIRSDLDHLFAAALCCLAVVPDVIHNYVNDVTKGTVDNET